jgi:DNA-binding CsgD family transcriptional regulator
MNRRAHHYAPIPTRVVPSYTGSELHVAERLAAGDSDAEIAAKLAISVNVVRGRVESLMAKTDQRRRLAVVAQLKKWHVLGAEGKALAFSNL